MDTQPMPYTFIVKNFSYNGTNYAVALTSELYPDEDGLDFTGSYTGILINAKRGTQQFELHPDSHARWTSEPRGMDPGLIDELDTIISEHRKATVQK